MYIKMKRRIVKNRTFSEITLDELFNEHIIDRKRIIVYINNIKLPLQIVKFIVDESRNNFCLMPTSILPEESPSLYEVKLSISLKSYIEYLLNSNEYEIYFEDNHR